MSDGVFVLLDGNYQAYRFHFGLPALTGPDGRPTGATRAFADLFNELRGNPRVSHWALVLDHRDPSFRHRLYAPYKAQRPPMPDEIRSQLADIERLALALDVPVLRIAGFEADDVLVTLARLAAANGLQARICTRDKDIDQCLDERIRTWDPVRGELRGPAELFRERGIRPDQVIDYLTLTGDNSDNIPGVKGVGPKRALQLLERYGSAAAALAAGGEVPGALGRNLCAFREQAPLTRELVTIVDVPDLPPIEHFRRSETPPDTARATLEQLGFHPARFFPRQTTVRESCAGAWHLLVAPDRLGSLAEALRADPPGPRALAPLALGDDPHHCHLQALAIAPAPAAWCPAGIDRQRSAVVLPILGPERERLLDWDSCAGILGEALAAGGWVVRDRKATRILLDRQGLALGPGGGDLRLAAWLLDEPAAIPELVRRHLDEQMIGGRPPGPVAPLEAMAAWLADRAHCMLRLHGVLHRRLQEEAMLHLYQEEELPFADLLATMERRGLPLDPDELGQHQRSLTAYRDQLVTELRQMSWKGFSPTNPHHLRQALADRFNILAPGAPVPTSPAGFAGLADRHEFADLLYQERQATHLLERLTSSLPASIDPLTRRIHARFDPHATITGRLVSDCPDVGQLPGNRDLGREIRAAFVAPPGRCLVGVDLQHLGIRILAHLAEDPVLAAVCAEPDPHRAIAALLFDRPISAVGGRERRQAKAFHYGLLAGRTRWGLAQAFDGDRESVHKAIDAYRGRFIQAARYVDGASDRASEHGFVTSLAGRRRYIPELRSSNRNQQLQGRAIALACSIQGSAADILKRILVHCADRLPADADILLQIHDQILVECPDERSAGVIRTLSEVIEANWPLSVAPAVAFRSGRHWLAATP